MTVDIKYGRHTIPISIPEGFELFEINEPEYDIDKIQFLEKLQAILPNELNIYSKVGIVVSDKTRLCGYPLYLPWLIEGLFKKGALKENITFYVAYGTHKIQTDAESMNSYGEVFKDYKFVHHDCNDKKAMKELGITQNL